MGCVPTVQRDTKLGLRNSQIIQNRRTLMPPYRQQRNSFYYQQPLRTSRIIQPGLTNRSSQIILPCHSILSNNNIMSQQSSLIGQSPHSLSSIMQPISSFSSIPLPTQASMNSINSQYFEATPTVLKHSPSINIKGFITKNTSKINNQNFQQIHIQRMQFDNLTY